MIDNQLNYLNMAKTVMSLMDLNNAIWNTNVKISTVVSDIKAIIEDINTLGGIQSDSAKGATISEHEAWKLAAKLAEHVCYGLKAYYDDIDDMTSFGMVNYTIYSFTHGRRETAKDRMQKVHDKAAGISILALAEFNVSSQKQDTLKLSDKE